MRGDELNTEVWVITGSPVEFVLVGPKGKRNGILVKSDGAKLDLIGFAATADGEARRHSSGQLWSRLFSQTENAMCAVESFPLDRREDPWDTRNAGFRFAWIGACTSEDQRLISKLFNRYIADVQEGMSSNDVEQVEWSLAPLIATCAEVKARRESRRKFMLMLTSFFFIAYLAIGFYWFLIARW